MTPHQQRLLDEAQWAIEHQQLDRAVRAYQQLFKAAPELLSVGLKLGELYVKVGAKREAVALYQRLAEEQLASSPERAELLSRLALRLEPYNLRSRLLVLKLHAQFLSEPELLSLSEPPSIEALEDELIALLQLSQPLAPQEALELLKAIQTLPLEPLQVSFEVRAAFELSLAERARSLQDHAAALSACVWLTLEGEQRGERAWIERFAPFALEALDQAHQGAPQALSSSQQRLFQLAFARSDLKVLERDEVSSEAGRAALIERAFLLLEPYTQAPLLEDPEAQLLLSRLLRVQGHKLHADTLLHQLGAEASRASHREVATRAYRLLLSWRPQDQAARDALKRLQSRELMLGEAREALTRGEPHHALERLRELSLSAPPCLELLKLLREVADELSDDELSYSAQRASLDLYLEADSAERCPPELLLSLCLRADERALELVREQHALQEALMSLAQGLQGAERAQFDELLHRWRWAQPSPLVFTTEASPLEAPHNAPQSALGEPSDVHDNAPHDEAKEPSPQPSAPAFNLKLSVEERLARLAQGTSPVEERLHPPQPLLNATPFKPLPFPAPLEPVNQPHHELDELMRASAQGDQAPLLEASFEAPHSARFRARALEQELLSEAPLFTPAPLELPKTPSESASSAHREGKNLALSEPLSTEAPTTEAPTTEAPTTKALETEGPYELIEPLITLPPLASRRSKFGVIEEEPTDPNLYDDEPKALKERGELEDLDHLNDLLGRLQSQSPLTPSFSPSTQTSPQANTTLFELNVDPLSLFDSAVAFEGALSPDHPLFEGDLEGLFDREDELERDLEEQLTKQLTPEPVSLSLDGLKEDIEEVFNGRLEGELNEQRSSSAFALTLSKETAVFDEPCHLTHPALPPLEVRVSSLSGHPLREQQRSIVSLISARQYELALSLIPPHLNTVVTCYLRALCKLGLGELSEALALTARALPALDAHKAPLFYTLIAELYARLGDDAQSERYLLELLSISPQLGAALYSTIKGLK